MAKYVDVCLFPISKKHLAAYKKNTASIGKILLKHGALASRDFVADDDNATKLFFPRFEDIILFLLFLFRNNLRHFLSCYIPYKEYQYLDQILLPSSVFHQLQDNFLLQERNLKNEYNHTS